MSQLVQLYVIAVYCLLFLNSLLKQIVSGLSLAVTLQESTKLQPRHC
ncbi:hypothetical protein VPHD530_0010 [Vibrio phage D530]